MSFLDKFKNYKMSVNWNYVYWFNVCFIVLISTAAFGMALAAIITQPIVNQRVEHVTAGTEISITSNHCDTYFLIGTSVDETSVTLPSPNKVTGCTFTFLCPNKTSEISLKTQSGTIIGNSWTDNSMKQLSGGSVLITGNANDQISIISDGSNYRTTYQAVGVNNIT